MCIVMPSEQKTRTGTKYTEYIHKLIPEDEEKTSNFFQIILAYNSSTHDVPCLVENSKISSVTCRIPWRRCIWNWGMEFRNHHAYQKLKVQASEQPKKKPKSTPIATVSAASGSSIIESPKKRVPGVVDPKANTYSDDITLPGNQYHCGERFTTIDEVKEHKKEKHAHRIYICFSPTTSCLIQVYVGSMCAVFI